MSVSQDNREFVQGVATYENVSALRKSLVLIKFDVLIILEKIVCLGVKMVEVCVLKKIINGLYLEKLSINKMLMYKNFIYMRHYNYETRFWNFLKYCGLKF